MTEAVRVDTEPRSISWMKVPIIGMPGTDCGWELLEGAETRRVDSFKAEFGECDEPGRWMVGMMFVCDRHAEIVAREFGDDFAEIKAAIMEQFS